MEKIILECIDKENGLEILLSNKIKYVQVSFLGNQLNGVKVVGEIKERKIIEQNKDYKKELASFKIKIFW